MNKDQERYRYLKKIYDEAEALWHPAAKKEDYGEIVSLYTEILDIEKDFLDCREKRGYAFRYLEQYDEAIYDFLDCFRRSPDSPQYLRYAGETLIMMGEHEKAVEVLSDVLTFDSMDIYAREARARAYRILGRGKEAQADENAVEEYYRKERASRDDSDYYHYL